LDEAQHDGLFKIANYFAKIVPFVALFLNNNFFKKKSSQELTAYPYIPGVNFINILRTLFLPIFWRQKFMKPKCN